MDKLLEDMFAVIGAVVAVHLVAYITNLPVAEVAAYTALALVTISNSRTRRKGQDDE
jgi:hypothetical protein